MHTLICSPFYCLDQALAWATISLSIALLMFNYVFFPQDPQVVTGSHDTTIKFWDLVAGNSTIKFDNVHQMISFSSICFCFHYSCLFLQGRLCVLLRTIRSLFGLWHCIRKSWFLPTSSFSYYVQCLNLNNNFLM